MNFRHRLRSGDAVVGCFVKSADGLTAEVLTLSGFDVVVLDLEHGSAGVGEIEDFCRAVESRGGTPVVRLPEADSPLVSQALDAGACAVQVAWVSSLEAAGGVVRRARYPPEGDRGLASPRATGYGKVPLAEWIRQSNEQTAVIVQLETAEALRAAGDIARVPGVDAVFLGPTDLSVALGHPGEPRHPEVAWEIERTIAGLSQAGVAVGAFARTDDELEWLCGLGVAFIWTGMEPLLRRSATDFLNKARFGLSRAGVNKAARRDLNATT